MWALAKKHTQWSGHRVDTEERYIIDDLTYLQKEGMFNLYIPNNYLWLKIIC